MPEPKQKSFKEASFKPLKNKVKIKEEKHIKEPPLKLSKEQTQLEIKKESPK